ncbi:uncharacterized protein [Rutidosis leptorrhynchoides]|uniref:uncharacterized protein n=1 Tax=Rutidosis leptorrhynchoides TaxID=125765 RepID=UPI003A9A5B86
MAEMSSSGFSRPPPPPLKHLDLDLTIVSAKHLKNVNWRSGGDLKPYVVFWVDADRRLATKSDDSGSTRPVWNERFTIPIPFSLQDAVLTLEVFHSKPSETPKPLVGTLRVPLIDLGSDPDDANRIRTYELTRPSGRPQGKIRVKIAIRESYHFATPPPPPHPSSYYYAPPPPRDFYRPPPPTMSPPLPSSPYPAFHDPFYHSSGYYNSSAPPPPPPRPLHDNRTSGGYGGGPSAPVDYSPYDNQRQPPQPRIGRMGLGLAVGAAAGAMGGLALDDEEDRIESKVESSNLNHRENYRDYASDY